MYIVFVGCFCFSDTDYTPFFEAVLRGIEKNEAALQQLRGQMNRIEAGMKTPSEREEVHQPGLPDNFRFPLRSREELEQLNTLLSVERGVQKSMVFVSYCFTCTIVKKTTYWFNPLIVGAPFRAL